MRIMRTGIGLFLILLVPGPCLAQEQVVVSSPDGKYRFELLLEDSKPYYTTYFNNKIIVGKSAMGFILEGDQKKALQVAIAHVEESRVNSNWIPVYGERSSYPDQHSQALVSFSTPDHSDPGFRLNVRAYNEGVAFRYEFGGSGLATIKTELTEFTLPGDSHLWVSSNAQSEIKKMKIGELSNSPIERPLLAQLNDSLFVSIGEAALIDFARMKFVPGKGNPTSLQTRLDGEVFFSGPFNSPWRTIMAGKSAGEILENNYLFLNLNEPNQIKNTDWIKPGKVIREVTLTTQGGLACVDFAVKHHLQYVEFDAGWYGPEYEEASDATTITVDPNRSKGPLDLHQVIEYADSKGIGIILYVNRRAMEQQLDEILPLVKSWGVKGLKYGFVNVGSQEWTDWMHEAVRKAARYELMVDIHDEYRPTGYSRTYPNLMTQEGIRGDEESPDNEMVLKTLFVRMIAGAGDHTNCYFAPRVDETMGSHASQLAKSVCIYSPWQFLYWYDRPEGSPHKAGGAGGNDYYITEVSELIFFDLLPTHWDDTRIIEGYPGEYAVVARRSGSDWFVGALNGKRERDFVIATDFLEPGIAYTATVFKDEPELQTPTKVGMETFSITSEDSIVNRVRSQNGFAVMIRKD